jgi:hypothetical protein
MVRRGHEISVDNVRRFERQLGTALPEDYREFLLDLNGGRTAQSHRAFVMQRAGRRDETTLDTLHSLDDPDEDHDLAARQLYGREDYPENGLRIRLRSRCLCCLFEAEAIYGCRTEIDP